MTLFLYYIRTPRLATLLLIFFTFYTYKTIRYRYYGFIILLKSYLLVLWRRGAPCHTTSPHRLIPPLIKRSRILVSDGVVILISVKLYLWLRIVWLRGADLAGNSKKWPFVQPAKSADLSVATSFRIRLFLHSVVALCLER
jgi:hypothetical protein